MNEIVSRGLLTALLAGLRAHGRLRPGACGPAPAAVTGGTSTSAASSDEPAATTSDDLPVPTTSHPNTSVDGTTHASFDS